MSREPTKRTILDAVAAPAVFGSLFKPATTWKAWRAFLAALFALPMGPEAESIYRRHTGRKTSPVAPFREAWLIVGRRGGKSRVAALVAVFVAAFRDYAKHLAPGEGATVMVIAADRRQARVVFRYVVGLLESTPMLARMIERRTSEAVHLTNRVTIEVHTASFRAVRGYTLAAAILDEVAFWPTDDSANPDVEIVNALRPGMATIPGALLLGISSPYARRGILWEVYRKHHGCDDSPILCWHGPTRAMNPNVGERVIADALEADEPAARAEWFAEFRRDLESFVSLEAVDAVTVPGRLELPPIEGSPYRAFLDFAGGSGGDSATLAIAHRERRGEQTIGVLDAVREVRPPFSPETVCADFAKTIRSYGCGSAVADRWAGQFPVERMRHEGVLVTASEQTKSELYRELLPLIMSGRVELLEHKRLKAQLVALERRTSRGGKDSVDHPPSGRDDVSNAAAGALVLAAGNGARDPGDLGITL